MRRIAVFYDLENIFRGYNKETSIIEKINFNNFFRDIKNIIESKKINGKIITSRAYANWADYRTGKLRDSIVNNGIEPIQMFGFGYANSKNNSDIALAIDVMELIYTNRHIDAVMIISGDGGFSALVPKVKAKGVNYYGAGWNNASNNTIQNLSDLFFPLDEDSYIRESISLPKEEIEEEDFHKHLPNGLMDINDPPSMTFITSGKFRDFVKKVPPIGRVMFNARQTTVYEKISEAINSIMQYRTPKNEDLMKEGIELGYLKQMLRYLLWDLFVNDYMQEANYRTVITAVVRQFFSYKLTVIKTGLTNYSLVAFN